MYVRHTCTTCTDTLAASPGWKNKNINGTNRKYSAFISHPRPTVVRPVDLPSFAPASPFTTGAAGHATTPLCHCWAWVLCPVVAMVRGSGLRGRLPAPQLALPYSALTPRRSRGKPPKYRELRIFCTVSSSPFHSRTVVFRFMFMIRRLLYRNIVPPFYRSCMIRSSGLLLSIRPGR